MDDKIKIKVRLILEAGLVNFSPGLLITILSVIVLDAVSSIPAISEESGWLKIIAILFLGAGSIYGVLLWGDQAEEYFDKKLPERLIA